MADNINTTLTELGASLDTLTARAKDCCENSTSEGVGDAPPLDSTYPEIGFGEQFEDQDAYFLAKCRAANGIYDTVLGVVSWLKDNNVDVIAGNLGGLGVAVTSAALISGPVGWGLLVAEAAIMGISSLLIQLAVDFEDLEDAMTAAHEDFVIALFNAASVVIARTNAIAALDAASPPTSPPEQLLVRFLLDNAVLNQLFNPREDTAAYISPDPIDCGSAIIQYWSFPSDGQSWVFRDDSTTSYSASGVHVPARGAWEITVVGTGTGTAKRGKGTIYLDGLSIAVVAGNSVQFDFSATSDGVSMSVHIKVIYADLSEFVLFTAGGKGAGTATMDITEAGTIETIECSVSRSWTKVFTATRDIQEVRVQ